MGGGTTSRPLAFVALILNWKNEEDHDHHQMLPVYTPLGVGTERGKYGFNGASTDFIKTLTELKLSPFGRICFHIIK